MIMQFKSPILILIGSAEFPFDQSLSNNAFYNSSRAIKDYFLYKASCFNITHERVLDLFGAETSPDHQDLSISSFLTQNKSDSVIVHYVGHGGFLQDRQYCLYLRSTNPKRMHYTALKIRDFAETLRNLAPDRSVLLILDCCFSGAALPEFMGDAISEVVETQTFASFPAIGTALLAASSKYEPALTPHGSQYTMLAEALLQVLGAGIDADREFLSVRDVADQTAKQILIKYASYGVMPEVHSPKQVNANISDMPIFPNFGYRKDLIRRSRETIVYNSAVEPRPFSDWLTFGQPIVPGYPKTSGIMDDERGVFRISTPNKQTCGVNKYSDVLRGSVKFSYLIVNNSDKNIAFFVIPMQDEAKAYSYRTPPSRRVSSNSLSRDIGKSYITSPGHRSYTKEFGVNSVVDSSNGFSPYRKKLIPESSLGIWSDAEIIFAFDKENGISFVAFAVRINEGTDYSGPGEVRVRNVRIYQSDF